MDNQNQTQTKKRSIISIIRWLIFLPISIVIALFGNLLLSSILVGVGVTSPVFLDGIGAFVFSFLLVFSAVCLAPSKRTKVATTFLGIIVFFAVLSFILSVLGVGVFAERVMPSRLSIPVMQILGALYASFLVLPLTIRGSTLEQLWKEIVALGTAVIIFGVILSIIGLVMGIITKTWITFYVGATVLGMGIITEFFPYAHLFFRMRKLK